MRASLLTLLTGLLLAQASMAQTASTAASVIIDNRQIAITKIVDLNFGTIVPSLGAAGTATVGLSNNLSTANVLTSNTTTVRSAAYNVVGNPFAEFTVTIPPSVNLSNGSQSMLVNQFTRTGGATPLVLNSAGSLQFAVGATLNVNANQAAGTYTGSFDVTVAYN